MTQNSSIKYLILGLREGLKALLKESEPNNKIKETKLISEDELEDWEDKCNNKDCFDARMRLNSARVKLMEACSNYKDQEGSRNIRAGAATAASVASLAFMYKAVVLGSIGSLWFIAAGIAIALAINDSKSLIKTQKKLIPLNENYSNCLGEFKTTLNIVYDYCDPYCLQSIDMTIPTCE